MTDDTGDTGTGRRGRARLTDRQRRADRIARWLVIPLAAILAVLVLVFFVFFDFSQVDGPSMEPTLRSKDYVLLTKGLATPHRGDVIVLDVTEQGQRTEWVKRIVALGGDSVQVTGNVVSVNGRPEAFSHGTIDDGRVYPVGDLIVPKGTVYVMGDNRPVSLDSRFVGPFPLDAIHGKVVAVYAPISRVRLVPGP